MKKIFTFLFCAAVGLSSFAQPQKTARHMIKRSYAVKKGNPEKVKVVAQQVSYMSDPRDERNLEISKINYINNIQVQQVINNKDLGIWEKKDALDALEFQRVQQANVVYQKYSGSVTAYTARQIDNSFRTR